MYQSKHIGIAENMAANESEQVKRSVPGVFVRITAVVLTLIFCLAVLEIGLRVTGKYRLSGPQGFLAPRAISYGLERGVSKTINWPTHSFTVNTCDQGFRSAAVGHCPIGEKPYYAILGSSEVFGNGLDYPQTFIGVFGTLMGTHGIDVHNLAVPGHHFMEQAALFKDYLATAKRLPETVVICLNPLFVGGYDDIHDNVVVRSGELFGETNWHLPFARWVLANSSATFCFFRDATRNIQAKYAPRRDFPLSFYVERYSVQHPIHRPEKTADFLEKLKELEDYIRNLGSKPVIAYFPTVGGFELDKLKAEGKLPAGIEEFDTQFFVELARNHCKSENIQFIDAEPMLKEMYDRGETLNFRGDAHFNEPASKKIGELLHASLRP